MKITIRKNDYDEYEVPTPSADELYFTDDKDDAIGTAKLIMGDDIEIRFAKGTYQED